VPRLHQPSAPASVLEPGRSVQPASTDRPIHPEYADVMMRVRSFDGNTVPHGQEVQELASAGFYHVGKEIPC